jgi:hypothetical protein
MAILPVIVYLNIAGSGVAIGLASVGGLVVLVAATVDTFAKRIVLQDDGVVYRDFCFREHYVGYEEITKCVFDPGLGLSLYVREKLFLHWPPRSGHPAEVADEIERRRLYAQGQRRRLDPPPLRPKIRRRSRKR